MQAFPFTSNVTYNESGEPIYDRAVGAEILQEVFKMMLGYGIFQDTDKPNFEMSATGLSVSVGTGVCAIQGIIGYQDTPEQFELPANTTGKIRKTAIILTMNKTTRTLQISRIIDSGDRTTELLVRTDNQFDLLLGKIQTDTNNQSTVIDYRGYENLCPYIYTAPNIDVNSLYTFTRTGFNGLQEDIEEVRTGLRTEMENNLSSLSRDIQGKIDELEKDMTAEFTSIEKTIDKIIQKYPI